jgi:LPS-assembly lipoprotein
MQNAHFLLRNFRGGVLALALAVTVSGCGFSPVYSTGGSNVGPVIVEQIDGRAGYFLRQELDRHAVLEQGTAAPRTLSVKLVTSFASAALAVDGLSARTLYTMTANYTLQPSTTEVTPISGVVTLTVGYESLDQAYGDVALQADAEERAATQIADKVWADLRRQARARK